MRYVIDCLTATRTTRTVDGRQVQHVDFAVWLHLSGLPHPVTARVQPTEVSPEGQRPLMPPIPIGPITGRGTHQHSGTITDIEPAAHHRLTVRVHDGRGCEYLGTLDITRDDVELMATNQGPLDAS